MGRREVCGRRTGRPKTKFYVTLMARVPVELAVKARHYAEDNNITMSETIRVGLVRVMASQKSSIPLIPINAVEHHVISAAKESLTTKIPVDMYLGSLCYGKHEFYGTGKTLRTRSNRICRLCDKARRQQRRLLARS